MQAGAIDTRLRFEKPVVVSRDRLNGDVTAWRPQGEIWGEVVGVTGREMHGGDQMHEPVTLEIFIRNGPMPITKTWRCFPLNGPLKDGGPISIIDILPTSDRGKLRLQCTQGLIDG